MTDLTGKPWMAIGETDDPNAVIESYETAEGVTKGWAVELTDDGKVRVAATSWYGFGVALKSVAAGEIVPILRRGRVKMMANGVFSAAGVAVRNAGGGKVTELNDQPVNEGGAGQYTIYYSRKLGIALQKANADGDLIFVDVGS
jgi:hypothetical protein